MRKLGAVYMNEPKFVVGDIVSGECNDMDPELAYFFAHGYGRTDLPKEEYIEGFLTRHPYKKFLAIVVKVSCSQGTYHYAVTEIETNARPKYAWWLERELEFVRESTREEMRSIRG
jgi:hypothetical protein